MPNWKKVITSGSDAELNSLRIGSVVNANADTDKFLVLDSAGNVDYRTGAQVLSDIGAGASSLDLQDATDNGNTTTNTISVGGITVTSMPSGVDNSVVVLDSDNTLKTDEIDSRVWGSSLLDGTNGVNNRLATFTDSNSLNGEANLTFDGSTLTITGNTYTTDFTSSNDIKVGYIEIGAGAGVGNTLVGRDALKNNISGDYSVAFGGSALENNTTGDNNTAIGNRTLQNNIIGSHNTAVGMTALQDTTSGSYNTAVGDRALKFLLSDYGSGVTDDRNTALGYAAFENLLGGVDNIAIGYNSPRSINGPGPYNASGSIYIGSQATSIYNGETTPFQVTNNEIVIGTLAVGHGSNTVTIGNSSITNNYFSGNISGSDTYIDGWGSISASLSTLTSDVASIDSSVTLDDATDNGNTTTNTISVGGISVTSMGTGTDNSVVVKNSSNQLVTDEIDSRVWGSSLVDATNGVNNRLATFTDSNSLNGEANLTFDGSTLSVTGDVDSNDITIDGWGSVSSSLSTLTTDVANIDSNVTLDDATTNGNTTTNSITVGNATIPSNGRLTVGANSSIGYTAHFKSGSDAQVLIETDAPYDGGAGNTAGLRFKVEDTDDDTRGKAGIFYVNTDVNDWGRGELLFSTDGTQDNGNATADDWKLKIDGTDSGKVYVSSSLNIGNVPNAGADTDKFLVLDSNGNVDYRTGAQVLSDIGGLESNGGNLTPLQTYIDFKGLTEGGISFGGVIDPMPIDRWMGVWLAPSDGYIDHIRISPENDNASTDNVDLQLIINGSNSGSPVTVAMGVAGVNKKFTFGSSYSFSEDDRISINMNKNGNTSDLYAIQIVFRLTN